jgi:uncharacterized protein (DUF58 family)
VPPRLFNQVGQLFASAMSRRPLQFVWAPLLALVVPLTVSAQLAPANVLEHRLSSSPVAAGKEGRVRMDLSVKEGFKVAKRPAPKLQLNSTPSFGLTLSTGFVESAPGKDPDYFGGFGPVELKVIPAKATKAGRYELEAKLTYFYCAEQEKYCSRSIENLTIPIEVSEAK